MQLHVRKLHAFKPSILPPEAIHQIQAQTVPHRFACLFKLEAADLSKRADELRDTERREKARVVRESLLDKAHGLGRGFAKLRNCKAKPIGNAAPPVNWDEMYVTIVSPEGGRGGGERNANAKVSGGSCGNVGAATTAIRTTTTTTATTIQT